MVIIGCLVAIILLAPLAWKKRWKYISLIPALCLVIIGAVDGALGSRLSNSGFILLGINLAGIVGIICVAWVAYMVLVPRKTDKLKK